MKELLEMHRKMTSKFHDKLKKFCSPLIHHLGVSQFYHSQLSYSRQIVNIGLNAVWDQLLLSSDLAIEWPTLQNLNNFEPLSILTNTFKDNEEHSTIAIAKNKFKVHHCLELIYQTPKGIEHFGFALKSSEPKHHTAFYQELPVLKLFVKRYREEFKSNFPTFQDCAIDFSQYIEPISKELTTINHQSKRNLFLKEMGINIPADLTRRETEISTELIQGYSASQIGEKLFISTRTVEHHLERLKDKLNCATKSELMKKMLDLETIGYFP